MGARASRIRDPRKSRGPTFRCSLGSGRVQMHEGFPVTQTRQFSPAESERRSDRKGPGTREVRSGGGPRGRTGRSSHGPRSRRRNRRVGTKAAGRRPEDVGLWGPGPGGGGGRAGAQPREVPAWGPRGRGRPPAHSRPPAGAAPGGEGAAPAGTKKRKASDAGHRRESRGSPAARRRRWQRQCAGRGGPGAREDQPPPLRRCMVTTVRAMAEAVYRDVVLMQSQLARSPPDWEQLWRLAELRGRLCEVGQAFYTLASQAACSRPPESWLVPAPLPAGRGPVRGLPEQERRRAGAIRPQPRGPDPRRHRAQLWK